MPEISSNQNHLAIETRVQARQLGPMKIIPDPKDLNERLALKNLKEPLIYPIYNANEMKLLFEGQKDVRLFLKKVGGANEGQIRRGVRATDEAGGSMACAK